MTNPLVIAGRFPWRKQGEEYWNDVPRRPLLGRYEGQTFVGYDQSSPEATAQHCSWAVEYGISCLAHVWRGSNDGHMTPMIPTLQAQVEFTGDLRWCLFLGNMLPLSSFPGNPNFGSKGNSSKYYREWVKSLTTEIDGHDWFNDPNYLRVDGKPLVLCFRVHQYEGDFLSAAEQVRTYWEDGIYLVGMSGMWHKYWEEIDETAKNRVRAFDACTAWSATAGSPKQPPHMGAVAEFIAPRLLSWRDGCRVEGTDFMPSITAQYDKSIITGNQETVRFCRNRGDFKAMVKAATDSFNPTRPMVWIQTVDEWPEGTTIEPTTDWTSGSGDYADHYGFDFLEEIATIRGAGVPGPIPPDPTPIPPGDIEEWYDGLVNSSIRIAGLAEHLRAVGDELYIAEQLHHQINKLSRIADEMENG